MKNKVLERIVNFMKEKHPQADASGITGTKLHGCGIIVGIVNSAVEVYHDSSSFGIEIIFGDSPERDHLDMFIVEFSGQAHLDPGMLVAYVGSTGRGSAGYPPNPLHIFDMKGTNIRNLFAPGKQGD